MINRTHVIKPKKLRSGALIGVVSPAGVVNRATLESGLELRAEIKGQRREFIGYNLTHRVLNGRSRRILNDHITGNHAFSKILTYPAYLTSYTKSLG